MNIILFYLLIAFFLFFRYIRANKTIIIFLASLFFIFLAIYESRHNISLLIILSLWVGLQTVIAYLKEIGDERIKKLQKGYQSSESIIHFISFFVTTFLALFLQWWFWQKIR